MSISLVFDKFGSHPIDPQDVSIGNEQVYSFSAPSGDFLSTISLGRLTAQVTLKGVPAALATTIENLLDAYVDAVVAGNLPAPNVTIDSKPYAVKTYTPGTSILLNGAKIYPQISFTAVSNVLTVVS